jgi:RND family efflux transporter MFP subunit
VASKPAVAPPPPERPEFVAVVTSSRSKIISSAFTGRVERVSVHPGQRVRTGDSIAKLDPRELQMKADGLRGQGGAAGAGAAGAAATAKAECEKAQRYQTLLRLKRVSPMEATTAMSACNAARAQIGALGGQGAPARAERINIERQIAQAEMTSPIDGVVMMLKAKEGQVAQQGEPIARVFDPSDLLVRFSVPKEYRSQLALGGRVEIRIEGVEHPLWATIDRIADEEAPLNFAVVEADIDDSKLRPDELRIASTGRVRLAALSAYDRGTSNKKSETAGANR